MESLRKWVALLYLRYEIITCMALFEPWERILISEYLRCLEPLKNKSFTFFTILLLYVVFLFSQTLQFLAQSCFSPFRRTSSCQITCPTSCKSWD